MLKFGSRYDFNYNDLQTVYKQKLKIAHISAYPYFYKCKASRAGLETDIATPLSHEIVR